MKLHNKMIVSVSLTSVLSMATAHDHFTQRIESSSMAGGSSASETDILTSPEHYFQRDEFYSALEEMRGKYTVLTSESEGMFHPLIVPTHRGIRRIGIMPLVEHYNDHTGMPARKIDPLKKAFLERLWNDSQLYNNLRLVSLMSSHITADNLKLDNSGTGIHANKRPGDLYAIGGPYEKYVLKTHIQSLAAGLFSPKTYARYFCREEETCSDSNRAQRGIMQWGGRPVDNFRGHKAYYDFVDNQVDKIKLWACQLDHSVYIVGTALLGEYDFDKQGFNVTLLKPGQSYNGYMLLDYKPAQGKTAYLDPNGRYNQLFIPLGEEAAERLVAGNSRLYYAIRGEINGYRGGTFSHRADAYFAGVNLTFDLVGDKFDFFTDDLLTNKVFEKSIALISQ